MEIEVAGIVDDHRVVRIEEKAADEIERLRAEIGHDDLVGIRQRCALGEAHREQPPQRGMAERLVVLAPPLWILARGKAQRRWTPRSSTQESGSQPAPGQRKSDAPIIACQLIQDGSIAAQAAGQRLRASAGALRPRQRIPNRVGRRPRLRPRAGRKPRRPSISRLRASRRGRAPREAERRAQAPGCAMRPRMNPAVVSTREAGRSSMGALLQTVPPVDWYSLDNCTELSLASQVLASDLSPRKDLIP